jgi:hypothetical protein
LASTICTATILIQSGVRAVDRLTDVICPFKTTTTDSFWFGWHPASLGGSGICGSQAATGSLPEKLILWSSGFTDIEPGAQRRGLGADVPASPGIFRPRVYLGGAAGLMPQQQQEARGGAIRGAMQLARAHRDHVTTQADFGSDHDSVIALAKRRSGGKVLRASLAHREAQIRGAAQMARTQARQYRQKGMGAGGGPRMTHEGSEALSR